MIFLDVLDNVVGLDYSFRIKHVSYSNLYCDVLFRDRVL